MRGRRACAAGLAGAVWATAATAAAAAPPPVRSGPLTVRAGRAAWHLTAREAGRTILRELGGGGASAAGALGFRDDRGWHHATRIVAVTHAGGGLRLRVATDRAGVPLVVRLAPAGQASVGLSAAPAGRAAGVTAMGIGFAARAGERFVGFGERANAVDQRGRTVRDEVSDGPFQAKDCAIAGAVIPAWAFRCAPDASRYPIPWLLSTRGYGVLDGDDEASTYDLRARGGHAWSLTVDAAHLHLRVFPGPTPARALQRFTAATGRQPPAAAAWAYGPWFQTGQPNTVPLADERRWLGLLQRGQAPVSAAETQLRYLPCGLQRGHEAYERRRVRMFHARGLAVLTYLNPELCSTYRPVYGQAAAAGGLQRQASGAPFTFPAFVGGVGTAGFEIVPVAQYDFTARAGRAQYSRRIAQVVAAGHDGWMEDFGEYTSPDVRSADGTPGAAMHNRYPTTYHCATDRLATHDQPRPLVRFQRSGWTGAARCAQDVWGGDPTTVFGDDGLRSSVRQALTMGLSGVSRWGSDIGGYDTFSTAERLTPELLKRWIEFGAVSAVMRTKASGLAFPAYARPQIWQPAILPTWRRYARLHTQLSPYILGAEKTYRHTGMPLMAALLLRWPGDPRAAARDDEFMFGSQLLAAPVLSAGARRRRVYLPAGRWIDWNRSVAYRDRGGGFDALRAHVLRGGRTVAAHAGLDELPLYARAGALLPLVSPDVTTLTGYGGGPGVVPAGARAGRLQVLAFPAGRSATPFGAGERLASATAPGRWTLDIRAARPRTYSVQASTALLRGRRGAPFRPCSVTADGHRLPPRAWRFDAHRRVLHLRAAGPRALHIVVTG